MRVTLTGGDEEEHCESDRHRERRNVSVEHPDVIVVSRTCRGCWAGEVGSVRGRLAERRLGTYNCWS